MSIATSREEREQAARSLGGRLNPTWVEWLMGFPLGWTDCAHLATPSFRKSLKSSAGASSSYPPVAPGSTGDEPHEEGAT